MDIDIFPPYSSIAGMIQQMDSEIGFEKTGERDRILKIPENLGTGNLWYRDVINGMAIMIVENLSLEKETTFSFNPDLMNPAYTLVCCHTLGGTAEIYAPLRKERCSFNQGGYLISTAVRETHIYKPGKVSNFTCLIFLPEFVDRYLEEYFRKKGFYPDEDGQNREVVLHIPVLTAKMEMAINTLRNNSFTGDLRNLYLETKVLEIITLFFERFDTDEQQTIILKSDEKDRIIEASRIIISSIESPPSISRLSRLVGLNEYKLRLGFKELFDNTVYGYLKQQRMLKAKDLLETKALSVSEAGNIVGYSNLSHFSEAFRKEFGINPGQLLCH
jgi:AraC-like DNA-binding protein